MEMVRDDRHLKRPVVSRYDRVRRPVVIVFIHYLGRKAAIHSGSSTGGTSIIALLPEENLGVAVLVNLISGLPGCRTLFLMREV